jgi:hypothetical protein
MGPPTAQADKDGRPGKDVPSVKDGRAVKDGPSVKAGRSVKDAHISLYDGDR